MTAAMIRICDTDTAQTKRVSCNRKQKRTTGSAPQNVGMRFAERGDQDGFDS
jgi:hypothetical protein